MFVLGVYDNIKDIDDFYFLCVVCDHWLYVIILTYDFHFLGVVLGLWVYNPCDMGIIYIIELGFIYSISFLFVFFWDECKGFFYYP